MGQIVVNLDVEMAKRKMSLSELAERVSKPGCRDGQAQDVA